MGVAPSIPKRLTEYMDVKGKLRADIRKLLETGDFADARLICYQKRDSIENEDSGGDEDDVGEQKRDEGENGKGKEPELKRVEIPVHRAILAAQSQFFADAFADGREEVEISEFPADVVRALLSFAYSTNFPETTLGHNTEAVKLFFEAAKHCGINASEFDDLYGEQVAWENALLGLLQSDQFSDARIVCFGDDGEKVVIPVHRCILSARSKFFATAFSIEMREAETHEVDFPPESGCSSATVRALLRFLYGASILNIGDAGMMALFKAAHQYQIDELVETINFRFHKTVENCCDWLLTVDSCGKEEMREETLKFIRDNSEKVSGTEGWRRLMAAEGRDQLKMKLPLFVEDCAELLTLANAHNNEGLMREALHFLAANKVAVKATNGWHRLMQGESEDNERLKTMCDHWLMETPLTVENCAEVLRIGDTYDGDALAQNALDFYMQNLEAVRATEGWRQLIAEEVDDSRRSRRKRLIKKILHKELRGLMGSNAIQTKDDASGCPSECDGE